MDDQDHSTRHASFPTSSFEDVWETFRSDVQRRCFSLLRGSLADADDAVSITAMKAFQSYRPLADVDHARAWLLTIARNVCLDVHRQLAVRRRYEISLDDESDSATPPQRMTNSGHDPEREVIEAQAGDALRQAIARVTPRLRSVAELRLLHDLSHGEIARELGMTEANVRKQMQHVRADMRGAGAHHPRPNRRRTTPRILIALPPREIDGVERDVAIALPVPRLRHPAARVRTLDRYVREHARGWRRRLELARVLTSAGMLAEAVPHYRWSLEKQPYPLFPWLELGQILHLLGRSREAAALWERGAESCGRDADRAHLRGAAQAMRCEHDAARASFTAAASIAPDEAIHRVALGSVLRAMRLANDAVAELTRAIELDLSEPLAPVLAHDALVACGLPDDARQVLVAAFARDPHHIAVIERLALFADVQEALPLVRRLWRIAPQRGATQIAAARLLARQGRRGEAVQLLEDFLAAHPLHGAVRSELAKFTT